MEYAGEVFEDLSMEGRMTVCNMSIEMGARGGIIAPDETTFAYLNGKDKAPKNEAWDKALSYWKTLKTDDDAVFDKEINIDAADIEPMITYGTNPGLGIAINGLIPTAESIPDEGERKNIVKSVQAWQLGETSDGFHLLKASRKYAIKIKDDYYIFSPNYLA